MYYPGIGFTFRLRVLAGINQQHLTHALRALFLQQRVELFSAVAEVNVAAVAECDHAIMQIWLETKIIFDSLKQWHNAVRKIALPGR